ncbi:MAG TPA: hypothetical protein VF175_18150 [Lacipirellula sp.]
MTHSLAQIAFFCFLVSLPCFVRGEPNVAVDTAIEPAAAVGAARARAGRVVRFQQRPTVVGDRVAQRLGVHLALTTKITQSGQTAHESTSDMRRQQQRSIEVLDAVDGRAVKIQASFPLSRRQSPEAGSPDELAVQPIEGKTYIVHREGDQLAITDTAGHIPPKDQYKLVAESLENVGKPNPLALLLVDRHVTVGQRILVPRDMVQQLLGFDDPVGSVRRFELTLVRVDPADESHRAERAVFQTRIEIMPNESSPLTISLNGEMVVETETCRLAAVELNGPVSMSTIERTSLGIYQYSAGGELHMAIRSQYSTK